MEQTINEQRKETLERLIELNLEFVKTSHGESRASYERLVRKHAEEYKQLTGRYYVVRTKPRYEE